MHVSKKKVAVVAAVAALGIGVSGTALGWWTSSGHGDGSATTGTSTGFTVTADHVTSADLVPGSGSDVINFTVHNGGSGVEHVSQVVVKVANNDGSPWTSAPDAHGNTCTAADFQVADAVAGAAKTFGPLDVSLAGENAGVTDDYTNSVTLQMVNRDANQDGCQNITVPIYVAAS